MSCPLDDALAGFAAGQLGADEAAAVEAHIDACPGCRVALSAAARGTVPVPRFGRYQLDTVLGAGGMGLVYRAFDPDLERAVAIKVVRRDGDDPRERARLVREARRLARLAHPNVCRVYDVGEQDGEIWVAMELIDGADLRQWAAGRSARELEAALTAVGRGLAAAHAAGLVHRDVKPQNVLVTRDGRPVVTDFGLALADHAAVTSDAPGVVRGTPAYLAPEQLTGGEADARIDQFAWAVMAWELLLGERPFPIAPAPRLEAIRTGLTPPGALRPALGAVLVQALAAAPRDRHASMEALLDAMSSATDARPGAAPRRPRTPRRGTIAAGALVATVIGGATWWVSDGGRPTTTLDAGLIGRREPAAATPAAAPPAPLVTTAAPSVPPLATAPPAAGAPSPAIPPPPAVAPPSPDGPVPSSAPRPLGASTSPTASPPTAPPSLGPLVDAGPPGADALDAAPPTPTSASRGFDRVRAERTLADCRFPVDPARPDPALAAWGAVADWGPVVRRERVTGTGADGDYPMSMFEVAGARGHYRLDGDAAPRLGSLDVAVGELVVVCPYRLPATDEVDHRTMAPGWRSPSVPVYAFAPTSSPPRTATTLAPLAPLHVPASLLRDWAAGIAALPTDRNLLVWARPRRVDGGRWDMGGWTVDGTSMTGAASLAVDRPTWLVVTHPTMAGAPGARHAVVRGVVAVPRLLD